MSDLRVWTNDVESCVAASLDDAMAQMKRHGYGESDLDPEAWDELDDTAEITIHCDAAGEPAMPGDDGVAPVTKTAREWCARGPGFLCTSEY